MKYWSLNNSLIEFLKINYTMKKYLNKILPLLLILIFCSAAPAQWSLNSNTENGKYSLVTNSGTVYGIGAGGIMGETILSLTPSDTSVWRLVTNTDNGMYSLVENKISFMGIDSGRIRTKAVYILNPSTLTSLGLDTNNIAYLNKSNNFIGRKQTFDTVNASVKYLLNGIDINTNGTLNNIAYMNGRPSFSDLVTLSDTVAMQSGYIVFKNSSGIRYTKSFTVTDTLYSGIINTGGGVIIGSNVVTSSFFTAAVSGAFNFNQRGQIQTPADGSFLMMNWGGNNFSKFELGAGNYTTGFYHGTVDTDITSVYLRSANGTLWYLTISDAGVVSTSTTAP